MSVQIQRINSRSAQAIQLRGQGLTLQEIGGVLGVTKERARQLLAESPIPIFNPLVTTHGVMKLLGFKPHGSRCASFKRFLQRMGLKPVRELNGHTYWRAEDLQVLPTIYCRRCGVAIPVARLRRRAFFCSRACKDRFRAAKRYSALKTAKEEGR